MPESVLAADSLEVAADRDEVVGVGVGVASSSTETADFESPSPLPPSLGSLKEPKESGQEFRSQGSTEQHPLK